ncbi:MAG: trypsin-like serine protease [Verrucomicrobia bacterium]|nr:trypsin-like serine protease [Verrucomicrobiota bacterium]
MDHYWILTAAHVADDNKSTTNLTINGEIYTQQEIVPHPFADLALVRYDKPMPGYYLLGDSVPVGEEVLFCGFGYSGNVVSTQNSAYFTDNLTGNGTKRWGSNRIDRELTYPYTGPFPLGTTTNQGFEVTISTTRINAGKTDYEAGGNVFDSGAGMFYHGSHGWELVGSMTTRTNNGVNYTGNFAVATKYHVDWIKDVIIDYDTDMDGLPDWWELKYGVDETSMERDGHLDSDDFTNHEEWLADTVPTNGTSFLEILDSSTETNLVFSSSTNRKYQVEYRTDLVNTNEIWGIEEVWFDGASPQTEQSVSTVSSNRFYRVRAKLR